MAFNKITNTDIATYGVQAESDEIKGSAAEKKAMFDRLATRIATLTNAVIDLLNSTAAGNSGANNIGSATISGVSGNNVWAQIADLKAQLATAELGEINPSVLSKDLFVDWDSDVQDAELTDYELPESAGSVSSTDTFIEAIGKLQKTLDDLGTALTGYQADLASGDEVVKKAEDVTTSLNGQDLTDIFEANGTMVKNATNATKINNINLRNDSNILKAQESTGTDYIIEKKSLLWSNSSGVNIKGTSGVSIFTSISSLYNKTLLIEHGNSVERIYSIVKIITSSGTPPIYEHTAVNGTATLSSILTYKAFVYSLDGLTLKGSAYYRSHMEDSSNSGFIYYVYKIYEIIGG